MSLNEDPREDRQEMIPVVQEELVVNKRPVVTGAVQVHKHAREHVETVEMPVMRQTVDVRRVVVNRPVDRVPEVREEGDTTIIPIVAEELVVTKRLILKEELHLVRRQSESVATQQVALRSEEAEVVRLDEEGNPTLEAPAAVASKRGVLDGKPRKSVLLP